MSYIDTMSWDISRLLCNYTLWFVHEYLRLVSICMYVRLCIYLHVYLYVAMYLSDWRWIYAPLFASRKVWGRVGTGQLHTQVLSMSATLSALNTKPPAASAIRTQHSAGITVWGLRHPCVSFKQHSKCCSLSRRSGFNNNFQT